MPPCKWVLLFSLSFLTLIILDTETAAYFLTVSFITLGNGIVNPPNGIFNPPDGIFNPPERNLHFESSLRLTESIFKVPASWGQQIPTLENRLSQKNFHSSFKALHFKRKWVKSSVPLSHKWQIAWSVSLSQGIPPCYPWFPISLTWFRNLGTRSGKEEVKDQKEWGGRD